MIQALKKPQAQRWIALIAGFAICLTFLLIVNETAQPYDSWTYVSLAQSFEEHGLLHFAEYAKACGDSMRGYLLPWIIALGHSLSRVLPWLDYRFLMSAFASLVCCVALPDFLARMFSVKSVNALRRLIPLGLLIVFFRGLLVYALSDLWAAGFAVLAVLGLSHAVDAQEKPLTRALFAALSGFSVGAAYNIRTIYLFLLVSAAIVLVVLLLVRRSIDWRQKLLALLCAAVGFLAASFPQMYINHVAFSSWSFQLISAGGSSLFINQLYDGIYIMKYETSYDSEYWLDAMNYADAAGLSVLDAEGLSATYEFGTGAQELGSVGEYIALVLRHPLDMLGVYARHFFSLLDIRYPSIYVTELEMNHVLPIVNYAVLYLSGWTLWRGLWTVEKGNRVRLWLLALLMLPVLAILPGAIEVRFGILLYLTLWAALAVLPSRKLLQRMSARAWVLGALGLVAFVGVMCAFGGLSTAALIENPLLY